MSPRLQKRYGQHHLRRGSACRPMVEFLEPRGERVLEIGPGGGVLSERLLAAGARLTAIEIDLAWAFELRRRLPTVAVAVFDALELDWTRPRAPLRVAGNLPFNVATPIVRRLLPHAATVPRAAFMVQKEVAERLLAGPGDAAYGASSVLVAALARASPLGTVPAAAFRPPPKVNAAMVGLRLGEPPFPRPELPDFERLVRLAFAQRRKTIRNSLASGWGRERAEEALERAGVDPRRRAQELPLRAFVDLHAACR